MAAKLLPDRSTLDTYGHGSRLASKAKGKEYGIAKNANLVTVKIALELDKVWPSVTDALAKVEQDIYDKGLAGKAFVNLSWHLTAPPSNGALEKFEEALQGVIAADAIVVTSAGNTGNVSIWQQ